MRSLIVLKCSLLVFFTIFDLFLCRFERQRNQMNLEKKRFYSYWFQIFNLSFQDFLGLVLHCHHWQGYIIELHLFCCYCYHLESFPIWMFIVAFFTHKFPLLPFSFLQSAIFFLLNTYFLTTSLCFPRIFHYK